MFKYAMQLRKKIIRLFGAPAAAIPLSPCIALSGQRLIVPVYHVISDTRLPHIAHLYPCKDTAAFESDLDFLLKYYRPVDVHSVTDHYLGRRAMEGNAFLLTFDDGLREFHDIIAPVLLRKGIPAVCFCNTAFIDNRDLFFRYKASLLIDRIDSDTQLLRRPEVKGGFQTLFHAEASQYRQALLRVGYAQRRALDDFAVLIGVDIPAFLKTQQPYLTRAQIGDLQSRGFVFGAHSEDHPEYRYIPLDEQLKQTTASLAWMREHCNTTESLFAFPFTDYGVTTTFFQALAATDYPPALTFGCAGLKRDSVAGNVQRIPLEVAGSSARQILGAEYLYYLLKALIGKNRIKRQPWK